MLITHTSCPVCQRGQLQQKLRATDFTVSGKPFDIVECSYCSARITQSAPSADEIGNYYKSDNYVSHTDTREGLINRLYHLVRKRTLRAKRKLVQRYTGIKTGNLLDVGAGTGAFAGAMTAAGWEVTALEPDEATRQLAWKINRVPVKPAETLFEYVPQQFEAITLWHVLEHVHDLHRYVGQLQLLLKPGGKLIIAVPNYTSYDASIYQEFWAAYDVPRHLYHFSPASIDALMAAHQLVVVKRKPMWFDSFYIAMLSEQYKTGHGNLLAAFFNGLFSNVKAWFNVQRCSSLIYIVQHK